MNYKEYYDIIINKFKNSIEIKDKKLYNNNKITINSKEKMLLFMNYINNWTKENHHLVAETII